MHWPTRREQHELEEERKAGSLEQILFAGHAREAGVTDHIIEDDQFDAGDFGMEIPTSGVLMHQATTLEVRGDHTMVDRGSLTGRGLVTAASKGEAWREGSCNMKGMVSQGDQGQDIHVGKTEGEELE